MSAQKIEPEIDYRRIKELSDEFTQHWGKLQATYLDAIAGFIFVRQHVVKQQLIARGFVKGTELDSEEFQDTRAFSYSTIFEKNIATSAIHEATQGEVKSRNALNGDNFVTLGQSCLIAFYDYWNDYLRQEYVIAKGQLDSSEKNREKICEALRIHASHDLWGEIRLLRQSIVHNRGIAISEMNRCKIIQWFKPGEKIILTPLHMREIFLWMLDFRNKLFLEHLPQQYIEL